jgi:purine-cytosine permease-like protein
MAEFTDHFASMPVPVDKRRGPVTMGLLWMTMVTCFPTVLVGFEWFKFGITLPQVVICTVIACLILIAYTVPAVHIAALTGKGYSLLNTEVFGPRVSVGINCVLVAMFVGFYGLAALLMGEGVNSLFHLSLPTAWLASGFAVLMALNNFFGFSGVANFARFVAAPVLIVWVTYTFGKAVQVCPHEVLVQTPAHSLAYALTVISSFVVGFAIWGNEADYWRYGKAKVSYAAIPFASALAVGMIIFPLAGWMVAKISGITDYCAATNFMSNYSFGGIPLLGALVLFASYFACNDSNLFGSSTALETMTKMSHKSAVVILASAGAVVAYFLAALGAEKALDAIAAFNCILLPTPTVIVVANCLLSRYYESRGYVAGSSTLSAGVAAFVGIAVGLATTGVLPGLHALQFGIPCLQCWSMAAVVFISLRSAEYKRVSEFALASAVPAEQTPALHRASVS